MNLRYSIPALTSYDLLKSLAVLLMVLDHVGYFFYPENDWFRAVGRASLPIWFFLIGFARSRDLSKPLWIGAGLLLVSTFILGGQILPLNVLCTIILTRLVLDPICKITFRNWEFMLYGTFALSVMAVFTIYITEYGTAAILIAMSGYLARHSASVNLTHRIQAGFMAYSIIFYAFYQLLVFSFDKPVGQAMVVSVGAVALILWYFRPKEVPEIEEKLPGFAVSGLQFGGRYTLEIYVVHLILFKLAACIYGLQHHGWFQWVWIR